MSLSLGHTLSVLNSGYPTIDDEETLLAAVQPLTMAQEVYPLILTAHSRLLGFKKSSEKLLELCLPYQQWFFSGSAGEASGQTPSRLPKHLLRLYERAELRRNLDLDWHRDLLKRLEYWSSWDAAVLLTRRNSVKTELETMLQNVPVDVMFLFLVSRAQQLATSGTPTTITMTETGIPLKASILAHLSLLYAEDTAQLLADVLSSKEAMKVVMDLRGPDAQSFLDLLDETMDGSDIKMHSQCMHALRKLCVRYSMLPTSCVLRDSDLRKTGREPIAKGGFADVWFGVYQGRRVAMKVIRIYARSDLDKINKRFYREAVLWKRLSHDNIVPFIGVPLSRYHLCIVCERMENASIMEYLAKNPKVNRPRLLVDISRGLQYLHSIGIVHGDLKGANILIDGALRARLTDFGLTALMCKASSIDGITTTSDGHGSARWMAPELLSPEEAGLPTSQLSTASDIYALGMVILEVFTGRVPFHELSYEGTVILKVMLGIRPERPISATALGLSDNVWRMMNACWHADRAERPTVVLVLQCMEHGIRQILPEVEDIVTHVSGQTTSNDDSDSE